MGFNLYRQDCTDTISAYELLAQILPNKFNYVDSSITGGRDYVYGVTAYNELGGESDYSESAKVTPIQAPSGMTAPTRVTHDLTSVTLQWTHPASDGASPVLAYVIYHKADYEATYHEVYTGMTLSMRITGL